MAPKEGRKGRERRKKRISDNFFSVVIKSLSCSHSSDEEETVQEIWQLDFFCWDFSIVLGPVGATFSSSLAVAGNFLARREK